MNSVDNALSEKLIINLSIIFSQSTGISNYAQNIFPYLKTLKPTLLTAKQYPEFNCYIVPDNLTPAQGTKGHFRRLIWTQFQIPQIYQQLKSQLLFSPVPEAPLYTNCRFVVMFHDLIPLRFPRSFSPLIPYHRYYTPQVLNQAQHIICNSQATAKDIIDFYQIPSSKITPILLAYDRTHFRPLNLPTSNYFLYIGRQDTYKNVHRLISAFAALPNSKDYELWLVGPSDRRYTPTLQAQVAELGITNQVKFLDYVAYSELPTIINGAIALVFPSLWEGFGLPVLEAMACGTPVITSNISSLPEVAGDAAILINPYNTEEITAAMQAVANDSSLRSHLSTQGITRANQFSWEKTGKATAEVLSRYF
ncbi:MULTISPECIES: glycosyltransferase family 4 protein [unclassified Tolypothrix]|uniref:glycosyltransferase family 4 protein n=1 Tax=unclassified Tolypothrix TaxID=2649714 RepID=UPI0005EABFB4|nr:MULTISPECIES: glycosyltransferase family 1 protein [unclassified Tolypothrix]BAY93870.1 group 1 glycosyl transferase [Microchaete diplosiphon NIES-3275]EKF03418.1 glycosyltransferase, group 1 family [Tolypothrix sp. PCC 7601]MBE9082089.1 glycosyltransferase family 4 protein [Tolypothrix sp. LEGE 11397]UYD27655.1 glycosyltransferase family 4 protein [Tolypothrix sp. PCC 7712]UYD36484.1 glycosyltransferase family 4 protein [Tolypothrix sp. PCC 7601]